MSNSIDFISGLGDGFVNGQVPYRIAGSMMIDITPQEYNAQKKEHLAEPLWYKVGGIIGNTASLLTLIPQYLLYVEGVKQGHWWLPILTLGTSNTISAIRTLKKNKERCSRRQPTFQQLETELTHTEL